MSSERGFSVSKKLIGAVVASWIVTVAIIDIVPTMWGFAIAAGYILLSSGALLYVAYQARDDEDLEEALEDFTDSAWWDARTKTADRVLPAVVLVLMLVVQIIVADAALSEEVEQSLSSLISIGPIEVGVFSVIFYLIMAWLLGPMAGYFLRRSYTAIRTEVATDE